MRRNRARTIARRICALSSGDSSPQHELGTSDFEDNETVDCYQRVLARNRVNFTRSKIPNRVMFYEGSEWTDYSKNICKDLREGFGNGIAAVHLKTDGRSLVIDFSRMMEIDLHLGSLRWIAWIDVDGRCFFPELFTTDNCRVCLSSLHRKSKRGSSDCGEDGFDAAESVPRAGIQPETMADRDVTSETQAQPISRFLPLTNGSLLRLEDGDRTCKIVKILFLRGMGKSSSETLVTGVYRCLSGGALFQEFKKVAERTKAARGHTNIRCGWYGGDAQEVADIVLHGFGPSNVSSGPEAFGIGINLSPASHSFLSASSVLPDDNGERHVVLCRVVMGNMEEVQIGSGQAQPSCEEFDSGVDDVRNFKRFIVWSRNMNSILPEYVLTFKCSTQTQVEGSTRRTERFMPRECQVPLSNFSGQTVSKPCARVDTQTAPPARMSFPSLFAALEKSLPSVKTKMLALLYNGYKAGKVNRDVLIRKVRSIVGDALLISAIRSIGRSVSEQTNICIK